LFVAITDLVPLVGATVGGVVATVAGLLHSVPAGIAVGVFFVLYQQLENHLLQPLVFSRTVKLNPAGAARGRADGRRGPPSGPRPGPPVRRPNPAAGWVMRPRLRSLFTRQGESHDKATTYSDTT
jgi:hypothetical protein